MRTSRQGAQGRCVDERSGDCRAGVELGCAECRAVGDGCRGCPGDGGRGLVHRQRDGGRGRCVVGGVGGRQGDGECLRTSRQGARGRCVDERSGDCRVGVKLGCAERRAVGDGCRGCPGDGGRGLVHRQRDGGRGRCVVGGVGGRQGDGECLRTSRQGARGRCVDERSGDCRVGVKLGCAERRAVGDGCRGCPGDGGRGLADYQRSGARSLVVAIADHSYNGIAARCCRRGRASVIGEVDGQPRRRSGRSRHKHRASVGGREAAQRHSRHRLVDYDARRHLRGRCVVRIPRLVRGHNDRARSGHRQGTSAD